MQPLQRQLCRRAAEGGQVEYLRTSQLPGPAEWGARLFSGGEESSWPWKYYEHNGPLVTNVHPSEWVSPEPSASYNLVVMSAGADGG